MHASYADLDVIMGLIEEAHNLSETYRAIPLNLERTRTSVESMLVNPRCLVAFNGDGVLLAAAADSLWHEGLHISDVFCYARRNGRALIREYREWAAAFPGQNDIYLSVTFGGEAGGRTERLYQQLGFEQSGTIFKVNV